MNGLGRRVVKRVNRITDPLKVSRVVLYLCQSCKNLLQSIKTGYFSNIRSHSVYAGKKVLKS